jgi:hypothetical protein
MRMRKQHAAFGLNGTLALASTACRRQVSFRGGLLRGVWSFSVHSPGFWLSAHGDRCLLWCWPRSEAIKPGHCCWGYSARCFSTWCRMCGASSNNLMSHLSLASDCLSHVRTTNRIGRLMGAHSFGNIAATFHMTACSTRARWTRRPGAQTLSSLHPLQGYVVAAFVPFLSRGCWYMLAAGPAGNLSAPLILSSAWCPEIEQMQLAACLRDFGGSLKHPEGVHDSPIQINCAVTHERGMIMPINVKVHVSK